MHLGETTLERRVPWAAWGFATRLVLLAFAVTLLGGFIEVLVLGGKLHIGGWDRPLAFLSALALLRVAPRALAKGAPHLGLREVLALVGLPLFVLATANGRVITSGDNLVTRRLGVRLLRGGTFDFAGVPEVDGERLHYSALRVGSRVLPSFPVGTALLALPASAAALARHGGTMDEDDYGALEKTAAAALTSGAAVLFFLALRRRSGARVALAATALFALATPAFTTASQAMWSFTGEVFLLCLVLFLVFPSSAGDLRPLAAGLAGGAAFLCRPTALIPAGLVLLVLAARSRRQAILYGAALAASTACAAVWLRSLYGHALGGYGLMNSGRMWGLCSFLEGLAGSLVSPSRGLLVHAPWLLLVPLGCAALRADRELRAWWLASLATLLSVLALVASYVKWWGGASLGPRLFTETSPFLALLALPLLERWGTLGPRRRIAFAAAAAFAVATQLLGAYDPRVSDWNAVADPDVNRSALWSVRDSQLAAAWMPWRTASPAARPWKAPVRREREDPRRRRRASRVQPRDASPS